MNAPVKISLFGHSSNGKIKVWEGIAEQLEDYTSRITIKHGYLDGKMQIETKNILVGKNIGKSNETSTFEQACFDLRSLANKKIDSGYSDSIDSISNNSDGMFLPMLAHKWDDHSKKISFPAVTQPKFDGARMLAKKENGKVYMWSRKAKEITIPTEIMESLNEILKEGESLDGELYKHGWGFQRIISAIKKRNGDTPLLEYHVYDSPDKNSDYKKRFVSKFGYLNIGETKFLDSKKRIVLSPTINVANPAELFALEDIAIDKGYEGLMVRNYKGNYEYKNRSYDLLKLKRFEDSEFKIVGGKEGTGRDAGTVVFSCDKNGQTFDVRPIGTIAERTEYFKNLSKYIGKMLTVKHQGLTDDGLPRFPVGMRIRTDWDM